MKEPTISIVVPVYRVEDYLPRALDSVLAQTYAAWDMILIDDGSPDRCGAICDEYAAGEPRIHVIHQKNAGVSAARNAGIDAADGEYLFCLDPDDYLAPDALETLMKVMQETGADIVVGGHNRVEADGRIHCDSDVWPDLADTGNIQRAVLLNRLPNFVWGRLYRRGVWDGVRMPEGEVMEDLYVCPSLYVKARRVVLERRPLYFYSHENIESIMAVSGEKYARLRYGKFLAWREHERVALAHFPDCAEACAAEAFYAGVRAYCLDAGKEILTQTERREIEAYIAAHPHTSVPGSIRWMAGLIERRQRGMLLLLGALQRRLVDHQQKRRQKKMERKLAARAAETPGGRV